MNTITAQFDLEIDNFKEEIFDYAISLFGINDRLVLDNELGFNLRIEELNILEEEVTQIIKEEFNESNKAIYHHAIDKAKHKYLIKILRDFLVYLIILFLLQVMMSLHLQKRIWGKSKI